VKLAGVILALLLGGASVGCAEARPPFGKIEPYTGRLETEGGAVCSGTRYYEAIITCGLCMEGPGRRIAFQGIRVNVTRVWIVGENIYFSTDRNWGPPPKFGKARKGDTLYMIGNAGGFDQLARTATLAGFADDALPKVNALLIACGQCWHGDSGAGVFNQRGELVAVYLGSYNFHMIERTNALSVFSVSIAVPVL